MSEREPDPCEPESGRGDLDARFADALAGWDLPAPERPELDRRQPARRDPDPAPGAPPAYELRTTPNKNWRSWIPAEPDQAQEWEGEGGYTPPPPEPLPGRDNLGFWAALICLVGGVVLLLWTGIFNRSAAGFWLWLGVGMTLAGFAISIARRPRHDDDHDTGAQV